MCIKDQLPIKTMNSLIDDNDEMTLHPESHNDDTIMREHHIQDEVMVLTEAIHLLTTSIIATGNGTDTDTGIGIGIEKKGAKYCCQDEDERLEQLQRQWKLEETGFIRLYNACMQMKQTIRLTAIEADEAVMDVNKANRLLLHERHQVKTMKKVIKNLYQENLELRDQNQELEHDSKKFQKEKKVISHSLKKIVKSWRREREDRENDDIKKRLTESQGIRIGGDCSADGTESTCTSSSSTSLITDDGCVTLRLGKYEKTKFIPPNVCRLPTNSKPPVPVPNTYHRPETSKPEKVTKSIPTNVCRPPENNKPAYQIIFKSNISGLQFLPFKVHISDSGVDNPTDNTNTNTDINTNTKANTDIIHHDFLVCGYKGFRDNLYKRPSFGARLINVGDKSEHEIAKWTMSDLVSFMRSKRGSGSIKMIFRNEDISTERMKALKKRARELGFRV